MIPRIVYFCIVVLSFGLAMTALNLYWLHRMQAQHFANHHAVPKISDGAITRPIVWVQGNKPNSGYLEHVFQVFSWFGYTRGGPKSNWDVLWAHDYPFTKIKEVKELQPHQRVNHWPGSGWVTNKGSLAKANLTHVPLAFKIPQDKDAFMNYVHSHPDSMWVQKSSNHRGIRIKKVNELELDKEGTFVQQYVDKPLLIDHRKFDIGIYVIITSIHPMRIYVYEGDCLLRFCSKDYYPFTDTDPKKYVVDDNYTPTWEIPSVNKFYEKNFTYKQSIFAYLRSIGRNPEALWEKFRTVVKETYRQKEHKYISSASSYHTMRHFFEIVRFDFILDEAYNVYLMEVNMSPNLSSKHFLANRLLYQQVLVNFLTITGLASSIQRNSLHPSSHEIESAKVSDRDIQVFAEFCAKHECAHCLSKQCQLCDACLSEEFRLQLKNAFLEHQNRMGCRRVLPPPMSQDNIRRIQNPFTYKRYEVNLTNVQTGLLDSVASNNERLMSVWFHGKCLQDIAWCV